jgi:hypothetical protein
VGELTSDDWTTSSIADIAAHESRAIAIGPFGSALTADMYSTTGVPLVRGQDIGGGKDLCTTDEVYVPEAVVRKFPACLVWKTAITASLPPELETSLPTVEELEAELDGGSDEEQP